MPTNTRPSRPSIAHLSIDHSSIDHHEHTNRCWWNPDEARWVCREEAPTPDRAAARTGPDRALVDVRDMIVVHTAMLREFRLAAAAVTRTPPGDRRQVRAVAGHLRFLCDMLHHHHDGEDALLWPKLRQRTPRSAGRLIDGVEAQHRDLDAAVQRVQDLRDAWSGQPDVTHRDRLAAELDKLHALLSDHLDLEERALLPLAASALTVEEWHAIGDAAVAAMPKAALPLAFGMFAYEGDPAVLRDMLETAPPLPRKLLPLIAPRVYARRARRIHGTARP